MEDELYEPDESFRDSIGTIDQEGKRNWIFPKKPKGRFFEWRKWVSYLLLVLLFAGPFIRIGGEPLLLFNFIERKSKLSVPPRTYGIKGIGCKNVNCISHESHIQNVPSEFMTEKNGKMTCIYCDTPHLSNEIWRK